MSSELSVASRCALRLIRGYKLAISPWTAGCCRFVPSCADYSAEAIARHGVLTGSWLGLRRLSRCHPLGGHGFDPVTAEAGSPQQPSPHLPVEIPNT